MIRSQQWTLITGASSGLGWHFAHACAQRGDSLLLISRSAHRLDAAIVQLKQQYPSQSILSLVCDLTAPDASTVVSQWLTELDIIPKLTIHNAGFGVFGRFAQLPQETITQQLAIHATFPFTLTRELLPRLQQIDNPQILFIASTAAFTPVPYLTMYAAAKASELHAALALRYELADAGIQICCCCPGPLRTRFFEAAAMPNRPPFPLRLMDPATVARYTLRRLERNEALIIPGILNRWIARFSQWLPKSLSAKIAAMLYQPMLNQIKE